MINDCYQDQGSFLDVWYRSTCINYPWFAKKIRILCFRTQHSLQIKFEQMKIKVHPSSPEERIMVNIVLLVKFLLTFNSPRHKKKRGSVRSLKSYLYTKRGFDQM